MRLKRAASVAAAVGLVAGGIVVAPTLAGALTPELLGRSGGTQVLALGGAVVSDFTARSAIDTVPVPRSSSNAVASADLKGLGSVGAIRTSQTAQAVPGGKMLVSRAHAAGVKLLGGLITASAVDTTATVTFANGTSTAQARTTFVGLKIVGVSLPVTIPPNFGVSLKGIATIALNGVGTATAADGRAVANASGLYVKLLTAQGGLPAGTQVFVTPAQAQIVDGVPAAGLPIYGAAYATQVHASALGSLSAYSGPTALNVLQGGGTDGTDRVDSTARADIPGVASIGTVQTTVNGYSRLSGSAATTTVDVADVNLLGGLVRADALRGTASVSRLPGAPAEVSARTTIVNLVIAGRAIPVDVAPNTRISVGNIAVVTINARTTSANAASVRLLDITLTTAGFGLPVGAEIEVGTAFAVVG